MGSKMRVSVLVVLVVLVVRVRGRCWKREKSEILKAGRRDEVLSNLVGTWLLDNQPS